MNKKLRFMWMLLLTFVCSTIWAEKYEYGNEKEYSKVSFAATTDASETNVLTKVALRSRAPRAPGRQ